MRNVFYVVVGVFVLCCLMAFLSPYTLQDYFNRFWLAAGNICSFLIICAFFGFIVIALYRWATRR